MRRLRILPLFLQDDSVSLIFHLFHSHVFFSIFLSLVFALCTVLHCRIEYVYDILCFWTDSVRFSLQVAVWFIVLLVLFLLVFPVGSAVCTYVMMYCLLCHHVVSVLRSLDSLLVFLVFFVW